MRNKSIYIDGELYATPSDDGLGLRAQCGFVVGYPSDSASTISLHSHLVNKGEAEVWRRGKRVKVTYQ